MNMEYGCVREPSTKGKSLVAQASRLCGRKLKLAATFKTTMDSAVKKFLKVEPLPRQHLEEIMGGDAYPT